MKTKIVGILMVAILLAAAVVPIGNTLDVEEHGDRELSYNLDETKPNRPQSTPLLPPFLLRLVNGDWDYWSNPPHLYTIPDGNVGIGTDTPTDDLHVKGDLNYQAIFESTDAAGGIGLRADTGQAYGLLAVPADYAGLENYFVIHDVIADQTRLSIDKTGNIIINTPGAGLTFPDGTTQTTAGGGGDGGDNDWAWASGSGINGNIYHMGKVGIGTSTPGSKLEVHGIIHSTTGGIKFPDGSVQTTAAGGGGAGFPRPDYDSGWIPWASGHEGTLHHGLGGNVDNYVVDLQARDDGSLGITNIRIGGDRYAVHGNPLTGDITNYHDWGYYYKNLDTDSITLKNRGQSKMDELRVRIWVYE